MADEQEPDRLSRHEGGVRSAAALRRLNVGCGPYDHRDDWWNIDLQPFPGVDQSMDITRPWPFRNLEHIYAEHFLEHLDPRGALAFLDEALSALEVGGRLRLSTPSLEWVLKTHFTFSADQSTQLKQTFGTNLAFHGWGHKFLYTRPALEWLLPGIGFTDVEFFDYGESNTPEFKDAERHGGFSIDHGYPSVWIVEAARPEQVTARSPELEELFTEYFIQHLDSGTSATQSDDPSVSHPKEPSSTGQRARRPSGLRRFAPWAGGAIRRGLRGKRR